MGRDDKHRRRFWIFGTAALLVSVLVIGAVLWIRSDAYRARAAVGGLDGVASVERDDDSSPSGPVQVVEIDTSADMAEIEEILGATYGVVDDDQAGSARLFRGSAEVVVHPLRRFRSDISEAAEFLTAFSEWEDGRAVLRERDVTVTDTSRSPMENTLGMLTALETTELPLDDITVQDREDWAAVNIYRLQPVHREVVEALVPWEASIRSLSLEGKTLTLRTTEEFDQLQPLAEAAQGARELDPESAQVTLETPDERTLRIGDEDPSVAFELIGDLADAGWAVRSLGTRRLALDVSFHDHRTDPSQLPGLAAHLRSAGLPDEAQVRVDEGRLFSGTRTELDELAPALADAYTADHPVRWTHEVRGEESTARIWVEMPPGHSLTDDSDLTEAMRIARSVPWPGAGEVIVSHTPESGNHKDEEMVVIESTVSGTALEVWVDHAPGSEEEQVRQAWDSTAE